MNKHQNSSILIMACGDNAQAICEEINKNYADIEEVAIEVASSNINHTAKLVIFVGSTDNMNICKSNLQTNCIDLSDDKISHLVNIENDINIVRKRILDGILAPYLDSIIPLEISEIINLLCGSQGLHIGMSHFNIIVDSGTLINNAIASSEADISKCNGVYLSVSGDVDMIRGNEIANQLQEAVGEDKYIVWSILYNDTVENECTVIIVFTESGCEENMNKLYSRRN